MRAQQNLQRDAKIVQAVKRGEDRQVIAERHKLTPDRIGQIYRQGTTHAERTTAAWQRRARRDTAIVDAVRRGEDRQVIAERHGLTVDRIRRIGVRSKALAPAAVKQQRRTRRDTAIVSAVKRGEDRQMIAQRYGLRVGRISQICRQDATFAEHVDTQRQRRRQRDAEIVKAVKNGEDRQVIAERYRLAVSRVGQIYAQDAACAEHVEAERQKRARRNKEIIEAAVRGEATATIAGRYGLSTNRVSVIIRKGVKPTTPGPRSVQRQPDYVQLRAVYEGGLGGDLLAECVGVTPRVMYEGLQEAGTQFRSDDGSTAVLALQWPRGALDE